MFFSEKELKIAEDLAWNMLDGWNHEFMPNLRDYAYFYYKEQVIFDPWMNEKSQGLPWPDHESKESSVDPVSYYGQKTIEDYLVNLFLHRPEWAPEVTEKIKKNLNESGKLARTSTIMSIEVYVAMSEEQADEEHGSVCLEWKLPESNRIYFDMLTLPTELVSVVRKGWEREVVFLKKDSKKVFDLLYPDGVKIDYKKLIHRINGREVRLIGWGD